MNQKSKTKTQSQLLKFFIVMFFMIFSMILIRSNINRSEERKKGAIKDDDFFYRENPISKKNVHLASNSPKNTTINLLDQTPEWNTTSIKDYYNHTWRIEANAYGNNCFDEIQPNDSCYALVDFSNFNTNITRNCFDNSSYNNNNMSSYEVLKNQISIDTKVENHLKSEFDVISPGFISTSWDNEMQLTCKYNRTLKFEKTFTIKNFLKENLNNCSFSVKLNVSNLKLDFGTDDLFYCKEINIGFYLKNPNDQQMKLTEYTNGEYGFGNFELSSKHFEDFFSEEGNYTFIAYIYMYTYIPEGDSYYWTGSPSGTFTINNELFSIVNLSADIYDIKLNANYNSLYPFYLSTNGDDPDSDGSFLLNWTIAQGANNYSIYQSSSFISKINESADLLVSELETLDYSLRRASGIYYFIVVAHNKEFNISSNCISIEVQISQFPPGGFNLNSDAGVPDKDGRFNLTWTIAQGADNYSIYKSEKYITFINENVTEKAIGITENVYPIMDAFHGTHYYIILAQNETGSTLSNCIQIEVDLSPQIFKLTIIAGNPDKDGKMNARWTASQHADSYSLYFVKYLNDGTNTTTLLQTGITKLSYLIKDLKNGKYNFYVVALNQFGNRSSNTVTIRVIFELEDEDDGFLNTPSSIAGYDPFLILSLGIAISISLIKVLKRRSIS